MNIATILILLFQSTGGYGIQTVALSQQEYKNQAACENAAIEARKLNSNIKAVCVTAFK